MGEHNNASTDRQAAETVCVTSEELFRGARQVVIVHKADRYVLRITRQGKLILNK